MGGFDLLPGSLKLFGGDTKGFGQQGIVIDTTFNFAQRAVGQSIGSDLISLGLGHQSLGDSFFEGGFVGGLEGSLKFFGSDAEGGGKFSIAGSSILRATAYILRRGVGGCLRALKDRRARGGRLWAEAWL